MRITLDSQLKSDVAITLLVLKTLSDRSSSNYEYRKSLSDNPYPCTDLLSSLSYSFAQFNFDFVEVHRVREFYFRPFAEESDLENETDGSEETDTREDDEERLAANTSSSTSRPRARSIWNVDGELVTHPAIHIKYELLLF